VSTVFVIFVQNVPEDGFSMLQGEHLLTEAGREFGGYLGIPVNDYDAWIRGSQAF